MKTLLGVMNKIDKIFFSSAEKLIGVDEKVAGLFCNLSDGLSGKTSSFILDI